MTEKEETIESLTTGIMKEVWIKSISNEFGRLAHGNKHNVACTGTIEFISKQDVPPDKKLTYGSFF